MSNLTILNTTIRQIDNLFSLNELHRLSGSESKHQPTFFIRLETTKDLVAEIQRQDPNNQAILSKNGIGTYACKEIVIAYAAWISPQFHLVVLRAFLNQLENSQKTTEMRLLAPPSKKYTFEFTEDELLDLAWAWFSFIRGIHTFRHIYPVFEKLGSNMAGNIYGQGFEYTTTARNAHKVINRLTKDFQYDYDTNWRVLKHIRSFDPTFKTSVL